jgi:hypothetical protein
MILQTGALPVIEGSPAEGAVVTYEAGTVIWASLASSFSGRVDLNGQITPTTLVANINDYNPTGIGTSNYVRISSSANINLTGILAPTPVGGQMLVIKM